MHSLDASEPVCMCACVHRHNDCTITSQPNSFRHNFGRAASKILLKYTSNAFIRTHTHAHDSIQSPICSRKLYLRNAVSVKITPRICSVGVDRVELFVFAIFQSASFVDRNVHKSKWKTITENAILHRRNYFFFPIECNALSSSRTNGLFSNGFSAPF